MTRPLDAFPVLPVSAASLGGLAVGALLVAWLGVRPAVREPSAPAEGEVPDGAGEPVRAAEERSAPGESAAAEGESAASEGGSAASEGRSAAGEGGSAAGEGGGPVARGGTPGTPAAVTPPATPVVPAVPLGPEATGRLAVTPGRVAYLRCDGAPPRDGPSPCPRDAALETAVWAVVATLPRCADPPRQLGQTDLRVDLVPDVPTDVHARDVHGAPALDSHKLLACLAGPLSHVRTTMRATRVVVSFRFATTAE